jgi:hypothetical protein
VILLVLGSVLEIYSAIVILAPLIVPMGKAFGIDPTHMGIIFLANLELGFLFPPVGLNLLLSSSRFGKPLPYMYKQALPFLLIMTAGVLAITYIPWMSVGFMHLVSPPPVAASAEPSSLPADEVAFPHVLPPHTLTRTRTMVRIETTPMIGIVQR